MTVPGDNSVDIFTNDIGVVVITNDAGELQGYNLLVSSCIARSMREQHSATGTPGRVSGVFF